MQQQRWSYYGRQEPEPEPRYRYYILTYWWPYRFAESQDPLNNMARQGWRVIDIHWTGEKNEEGEERIIYHLEWTPEEKPASYTIKEERK